MCKNALILFSLALSPWLCLPLVGEEKSILDTGTSSRNETCGKGPNPLYVTMRHIEANGIGYNQGYTTLEGFFHTADPDRWVPFLDVRGHLFNNGKPAANVGLGLRQLRSSRVWGINAYYDYRKTPHQHYNQVSVGLESLGRVWDFRINGYLPFGKKQSHPYDLRFEEFQEHYAHVSQKFEFAMKGANAEVGAHVNFDHVPLYFAAGPYYLEGQGKVAWGGEARVELNFWDYIRLEGSTSYDNVFKWIGQGQISLVIPFGSKKEIRQKRSRSCKQQMSITKRALQRVDRMEIIPVDKKRKASLAIDPATGQPYFFWFVNNMSHSDGTFESPFPTLVQAQNASSANDVIYVYPGDGTTKGMNAGIILKNDQKLFGAGIDQILQTTAGTLTIPAMASGLPMITNGSGSNSITCSNDNEISGLNITANLNATAINCNAITNGYIHDNILNTISTAPLYFIEINNCLGQITVVDNQMIITQSNATGGIAIHESNPLTTNYFIANNTFINPNNISMGARGIGLSFSSNSGITTITNNQFININEFSIIANYNTMGALYINNNTFTGSSPHASDISILAGTSFITHITGNTWVNTADLSKPSVYVTGVTGSTCVRLINNVSDVPTNTYTLDNSAGGSFTADISGNVGQVQEIGTIKVGTCP